MLGERKDGVSYATTELPETTISISEACAPWSMQWEAFKQRATLDFDIQRFTDLYFTGRLPRTPLELLHDQLPIDR